MSDSDRRDKFYADRQTDRLSESEPDTTSKCSTCGTTTEIHPHTEAQYLIVNGSNTYKAIKYLHDCQRLQHMPGDPIPSRERFRHINHAGVSRAFSSLSTLSYNEEYPSTKPRVVSWHHDCLAGEAYPHTRRLKHILNIAYTYNTKPRNI